jgi:cell wall-associated NlpC family hydrolase
MIFNPDFSLGRPMLAKLVSQLFCGWRAIVTVSALSLPRRVNVSQVVMGLLALMLSLSILAAPGELNATPVEPEQEATRSTAEIEAGNAFAQNLMLQALELIGVRYRYGGSKPETGLDCSGFIRYVFQQTLNIALPHNAFAISRVGQHVEKDELKPGDLVFFNTLGRQFSHVGMYLGDERFVHSPSTGGRIEVVNMRERYWVKRFTGARRVNHQTVTNSQLKLAQTARDTSAVVNTPPKAQSQLKRHKGVKKASVTKSRSKFSTKPSTKLAATKPAAKPRQYRRNP